MAPFSFSLQSGQSGSTGPSWSVWGRHDQQRFDSASGGSSHDGALSTVHLGADVQLGDWLAGVSLARNRAEADYRFARSVAACGGTGFGEGMVDAELTSVHPYVGRRVGNGWVWATIGGGDGDVWAERCEIGLRQETDLSMRMAAVGGRHPFARGERIALSIVEEVGMLALTTGDVPGPLGDRSVTVGQARLGLEAAGIVQPGCECSLSSFVRVFARGDWGDGTSGAGLELAAGVRYRNVPLRLGIDAGVRALAIHAEKDVEDRSAAVTVSILPADDGTGLQASLAWRQEFRDLWRQPLGGSSPWTLRAEGVENRERRWVAASRIGYGLAAGRGATDTRAITVPFLEIGGGNSSRGIGRLGVRHEFGGLVVEWGVGRADATWGGGRQFVLAATGSF